MEAESLSAGSPVAESRADKERGTGAAETGFAAAGDGVIFGDGVILVDGAAFGNGIFEEVSIFEGGGLRLAGSITMNNFLLNVAYQGNTYYNYTV